MSVESGFHLGIASAPKEHLIGILDSKRHENCIGFFDSSHLF